MLRKFPWLFIPLLALLTTFSTLPWSRTAEAEPLNLQAPRPVVWKDFLGVNAHFLWFPPEQYQRQMTRYRELGLEWVRVDLHWDRHEPQEGQYLLGELDGVVNAMASQGLKSLLYLVGSPSFISSAPPGAPNPDQYPPRDPEVFANRMAQLSTRYPSVSAWQVWNEENLPSFWSPYEDPPAYYRLLQASVRALRAINPDKPVVVGGMAYYSQMPVLGGLMLQALDSLGLSDLGTIAAYHPYTEKPEGDTPADRDFIVHARQLNAWLHENGMPNIWATEWGWSSYPGPREMQEIIGQSGQADYLLRRVALMSALDYDKAFMFALSDLDQRATPRDRHYGLLDLQGAPKPAYTALRNFLRTTGPRLVPGNPPNVQQPPTDLLSIPWSRDDGSRLWMFWSAAGGQMHLPLIKSARLYDPMTGTSQRLDRAEGVQVLAKPTLQLLVWSNPK
ncbi:MAG: cellulase family glycosylhydrolase [Pseudomonas sp.]|uniref:cellulase family glycosylhydrolase n=1 Tax=Pseudomonas sp. TaxID=306 RepID=UPI0033956D69